MKVESDRPMTFNNLLESPISRRTIIKAAAVAAVIGDSAAGAIEEQFMTDSPEVKVHLNPNSEDTIIVVGGFANDGVALADVVAPAFGFANVIGVRYAETNTNADKLHEAIFGTMRKLGLANPSFFFNSASAVICAPILARHARDLASQQEFGPTRTVIFDSSPASEDDVRGFQGMLAESRVDAVFKRSRLFDFVYRKLFDSMIPEPHDRDPDLVTLEAAATARTNMINADTITGSAQAAALRDFNLKPGLLVDAARDFVYIHSKNDPLIDTSRAVEKWREICGKVEDVLDTFRPEISHASSSYPKIARNIFRYKLGYDT